MHLRPLTEGVGSRAVLRSMTRSLSDVEPLGTMAGEVWKDVFEARSAVSVEDMSGMTAAEANDWVGESLNAVGVRLDVGRRDDAAMAAPCLADELKMDEAALLYELAESTVQGMSASGESFSSR